MKNINAEVTVSIRRMNKIVWQLARIEAITKGQNMTEYVQKLILDDLKKKMAASGSQIGSTTSN